MTKKRPAILTITEKAAKHASELIKANEEDVIGLRLGISTKGCSGLSYEFEFTTEKRPTDIIIEDKGIIILLEPSALMYISGIEIDYNEDDLQSGFTFKNPNETGRCGCGESFHV